MSRRTPIKELREEDSTAPMSPRRSTRIAAAVTTRRASASDELAPARSTRGRRSSLSQDNKLIDIDDDSMSSTTSSVNSLSLLKTKVTRGASKSPSRTKQTDQVPARITRSRGSLSSLADEDVQKERSASPALTRITTRRGSGARASTRSPTPSLESTASKASTPRKSTRSVNGSPTLELTKSAAPKLRGRRPSITEKIIPLEAIEETDSKIESSMSVAEDTKQIESTDQKEENIKESEDVIEESAEEKNLFKKKKTVMMLKQNLHTITEKSFTEEIEGTSDTGKTENQEKTDNAKQEKVANDTLSPKKDNIKNESKEESSIIVDKPQEHSDDTENVTNEKNSNKTKVSVESESTTLGTPETRSKASRLSLSLPRFKHSPSESKEEKELKSVLSADVIQTSPRRSPRLSNVSTTEDAKQASQDDNDESNESLSLNLEVSDIDISPENSKHTSDVKSAADSPVTNQENALNTSSSSNASDKENQQQQTKATPGKKLSLNNEDLSKAKRLSLSSPVIKVALVESVDNQITAAVSPTKLFGNTTAENVPDQGKPQASEKSFYEPMEVDEYPSELEINISTEDSKENETNKTALAKESPEKPKENVNLPSTEQVDEYPPELEINISTEDSKENETNKTALAKESPERPKENVNLPSTEQQLNIEEVSAKEKQPDANVPMNESPTKGKTQINILQDLSIKGRRSEGKEKSKLPDMVTEQLPNRSDSDISKSEISRESLDLEDNRPVTIELAHLSSPRRRSARLLKQSWSDSPDSDDHSAVNSTPKQKLTKQDVGDIRSSLNEIIEDDIKNKDKNNSVELIKEKDKKNDVELPTDNEKEAKLNLSLASDEDTTKQKVTSANVKSPKKEKGNISSHDRRDSDAEKGSDSCSDDAPKLSEDSASKNEDDENKMNTNTVTETKQNKRKIDETPQVQKFVIPKKLKSNALEKSGSDKEKSSNDSTNDVGNNKSKTNDANQSKKGQSPKKVQNSPAQLKAIKSSISEKSGDDLDVPSDEDEDSNVFKDSDSENGIEEDKPKTNIGTENKEFKSKNDQSSKKVQKSPAQTKKMKTSISEKSGDDFDVSSEEDRDIDSSNEKEIEDNKLKGNTSATIKQNQSKKAETPKLIQKSPLAAEQMEPRFSDQSDEDSNEEDPKFSEDSNSEEHMNKNNLSNGTVKGTKQLQKSSTEKTNPNHSEKADESSDDGSDAAEYGSLEETKLKLNKTKTSTPKSSVAKESPLTAKTTKRSSLIKGDDLDAKLDKLIADVQEDLDSSSSYESQTDYLDDMAEEGDEDTPSDGSNDIIDKGESVGSTDSEFDSDETYEDDSFIDDSEDQVELLSGEEYDLGDEKKKEPEKKKRLRIIELSDSEEENKENTSPLKKPPTVAEPATKIIEIKVTAENDSDLEKMSTQPYCGLTPPSIVSIRDSLSDSDKIIENKEDEISSTSVLINKEDNLKSLEQLKQTITDKCEEIVTLPLKQATPKTPRDPQNTFTPNNSILETEGNQSSSARKRQSSITIHENLKLKDIQVLNISDRVSKAVDFLCSTVDGNIQSGNVSVNISLEYMKSPSPTEEIDNDVGDLQEKEDKPVETAIKNLQKRRSFEVVSEAKSQIEEQVKVSTKKEKKRKLVDKQSKEDSILSDKNKSVSLESEKVVELPLETSNKNENKQEETVEKLSKKRHKKKRKQKHLDSLTNAKEEINEQKDENEDLPEMPAEKKLSKKDRKKEESQKDIIYVANEEQEGGSKKKRKNKKKKPVTTEMDPIPQVLLSSDASVSEDLDELYNNKFSVDFSNVVEVIKCENIASSIPTKLKKNKKPKSETDATNDTVDTKLKKKMKKRKRDVSLDLNRETKETSDVEVEEKDYRSDKSEAKVKDIVSVKKSKKLKIKENKNDEIFIEEPQDVLPKKAKKKKKSETDKTAVAAALWNSGESKIQYFPSKILTALEEDKKSKKIKDVTNKNKPFKKPKVVPSTTMTILNKRAWETEEVGSMLLPSSSSTSQKSKKMKTDLDNFNAKDFKNKMLNDPKRVTRVDTKLHLKNKQKMKF